MIRVEPEKIQKIMLLLSQRIKDFIKEKELDCKTKTFKTDILLRFCLNKKRILYQLPLGRGRTIFKTLLVD